MCQIVCEYNENKSYRGYKYALKDKDGKYYSPVTGIEYKVGKVPELQYDDRDIVIDSSWVNVNSKGSSFYNPSYIGYTGVFCEVDWVKRYVSEKTYICIHSFLTPVALAITISGDLVRTITNDYPCVSGKHIDKIEEL